MKDNLILLDPFRSSLVFQSINDRIIDLNIPNQNFIHTPTFKFGSGKARRRHVLQMLLLYDHVKIIQDESSVNKVMGKGITCLSLQRLEDLGFVSFTNLPDLKREDKLKKVKKPSDIWRIEKKFLDTYEELVINELEAKGHMSRSEYIYLKNQRLNNNPDGHNQPAFSQEEMIVFTRINELHAVDLEKDMSPCDVAHFKFDKNLHSLNIPEDSSIIDRIYSIYKITVDELTRHKINFPEPSSLQEVLKLKNDPQIVDFKNEFKEWMNSFIDLNIYEEGKLRKKLVNYKFKRNHAHKLKCFSELSTYLSLPAGYVVDPSITAGVTMISLGMTKLANKWLNKSAWLSFGSQSQ
jgi:hypothetical protein